MRGRVTVAAAFGTLLLSTSGCINIFDNPGMSVGTVFLHGRVTDAESGAPLIGVRLSMGDQFAETDRDGDYAFIQLHAGHRVLTAAHEGYPVVELPVRLRKGKQNRFDFTMRKGP